MMVMKLGLAAHLYALVVVLLVGYAHALTHDGNDRALPAQYFCHRFQFMRFIPPSSSREGYCNFGFLVSFFGDTLRVRRVTSRFGRLIDSSRSDFVEIQGEFTESRGRPPFLE